MSAQQLEQIEQLQATLSKMQLTLEAIADAIVWVGADQRLQWCNSSFERLVNRPNSQIIGSRFSDLLPLWQVGEVVAVEAYPDWQIHQGEYKTTDYEFQMSDRSLILQISGTLADITNDKSAILVIKDVTPLKAESPPASATTEAKFRAIVENANAILTVLNLEGVVAYVSPNIENLMGWTPHELEGQSFKPYIYPDDQPKLLDALNQLVSTGEKQFEIEYRARDKNGNWRWQLSNFAISQDVDGQSIIIAVTYEISDRKQIEEALKASETRLNNILSSARASIEYFRVDANQEWKHEYCAPGCIWIWGYSAEEMIADKNLIPSRIEPEDWALIYEQGMKAILTESSYKYEYRYNHPDGNLRWISGSLTSVRDEAADSWIATVVSTDITERKHIEEALKTSETRLNTILSSVRASIQYNPLLSLSENNN